MQESVLANLKEYTVSELSLALKRTVEETYELVRVRGEVSGFKRATSGHLYLALKDAEALLDAVCWRGTAVRLPVQLEDGLEVVATGKLTTYPGRSKYQLVIQHLELAGAGALMALLEERKKKLMAEGLFDVARKRPLPFLPSVIGVITSPTGAVIRDILHRIADRFPRQVLVWPVLVQGEGAAAQIAAAINGFNALTPGGEAPRPDVLIVARGGGSIEDLWAFNEEVVVRAAAASRIPLISAVGHETDTTLIDFAADLRAPTPTAAAEKAVPVRAELQAMVATLAKRLDQARRRVVDDRRERLTGLARGLPSPRDLLVLPVQRVDDLGERLPRALMASVEKRRGRLAGIAAKVTPVLLLERLRQAGARLAELKGRAAREVRAILNERAASVASLARMLESLSYERVLARGFAVVRDGAGQPLTKAAAISPGLELSLQFSDGRVAARAAGGSPTKRHGGEREEQGRLL